MEDITLKNLWKEYDEQIKAAKILNLQSWVINVQTFEYLQVSKTKTTLQSLAGFKIWSVAAGFIWLLFLSALVVGNHFQNIYFTVSVGMIALFTIVAIALYVKHVVLIKQINYSESITVTQQKLSLLQASTINTVRILILQLPFYSTFFWHSSWINIGSLQCWLIPFPVTLFFVLLAGWLYRNINYKNIDKKWFRILFSGRDWTGTVKAMEYLGEIEAYKKEWQP